MAFMLLYKAYLDDFASIDSFAGAVMRDGSRDEYGR
jgi:hypothetical protein